MIKLIVACDENGLIGKNGGMPWYLPEDLKLFKERTSRHVVIMGRKTWSSLHPRLYLPNRVNFVVTSKWEQEQKQVANVFHNSCGPVFFPSLEKAINEAKNYLDVWKGVFIIGGAQIYKEAIDKKLIDEAYVSKIKGKYDGDTYFPNIEDYGWRNVIKMEEFPEFTVYRYSRISQD